MKGGTPCGPSVSITTSGDPAISAAWPAIGSRENRAISHGQHVAGEVLDADAAGDQPPPRPTVTSGEASPQAVNSRPSISPRHLQRVGPEEHPGQADHVEGRRSRFIQRPRRGAGRGVPRSRSRKPLDRQRAAVDRAPDDEAPRCAVPQAAEQEGEHQVAVGAPAPRRGCRPAGCRGSRAASGRASCASAARSPASTTAV